MLLLFSVLPSLAVDVLVLYGLAFSSWLNILSFPLTEVRYECHTWVLHKSLGDVLGLHWKLKKRRMDRALHKFKDTFKDIMHEVIHRESGTHPSPHLHPHEDEPHQHLLS